MIKKIKNKSPLFHSPCSNKKYRVSFSQSFHWKGSRRAKNNITIKFLSYLSDTRNEIMNISYLCRRYRSPNAIRMLKKIRITTLSTIQVTQILFLGQAIIVIKFLSGFTSSEINHIPGVVIVLRHFSLLEIFNRRNDTWVQLFLSADTVFDSLQLAISFNLKQENKINL